MARNGFPIYGVFTVLFGSLIFISTLNLLSICPLIIAYEVTDQNSEGIFSSLSRDFDGTLEEINREDDKSESQDQEDSSKAPNLETETLETEILDIEVLRNSSSTSDDIKASGDQSSNSTNL
ncbi:hypothetical protein [Candidatus Nitrosocosmicus franklandus]|uniref:Uncharacterized protein n=1 Tax=Candidatus Nitrosocosmicus franklandianus TaxID=1798806 RepID=A0A484IE16_9ARCH|nr:hypothetical protein [Candidatus Nitrosocosmicus franklandus]VFJ15391.1 protein of unknown function [Candidatus Nitrosocosmicus franklandus]